MDQEIERQIRRRAEVRRYAARQRGEDVPYKVSVAHVIVHTCAPGTSKSSCECAKRRRNALARANRQAIELWRRFKMTVAEWQQLFDEQGGRCAVCGRHEEEVRPSDGRRGLVVDHCHRAGHVRALLCNNCNAGLGYFGDDPERLRRAAVYLESMAELHPAARVEGGGM